MKFFPKSKTVEIVFPLHLGFNLNAVKERDGAGVVGRVVVDVEGVG